jgi:hypothetical protein
MQEALRDRERMKKEMAQLKKEMAQLKKEMAQLKVEMVQFEEKPAQHLEAIEISRVKAEKEMLEVVNEESWRKISESSEEIEQRLRVEAEARMKQETDRLEKWMEEQLKKRLEEFEQRQRNEQDLRDVGYDPHDSQKSATIALCAAVRNHHEPRIIPLLLAKGANPTSCIYERVRDGAIPPALLKSYTHQNFSALQIAALVGYVDAIRIFLKNRVDLNAIDESGSPILMFAASEAVAQVLLEHGADPHLLSSRKNSSLMRAAWCGYEAVVRLLLANGAELDIVNNDGDTALIFAARENHEAVVRLLLESGARPDIENKDGKTAFSLATKRGHKAVVRLLRASSEQVK